MTHLIIALDNLSQAQAIGKIREILDWCSKYEKRILFKFNDLLTLKWLEWIKSMIEWTWARLMLDPKWHDIPKTIANNFEQLHRSWLWEYSEYVTIHASNDGEWIRAGVEKRNELWLTTKILAVTALTSLGEEGIQRVFDETAKHAVLKLAKIALDAWADGIVCSPLEVDILREVYGNDFIIVNPGVRFSDGDHHDQKRVLTPRKTLENWSTDIVMWRWILESSDPIVAVHRYFEETNDVVYHGNQNAYEFEKILYTGNWKELLSYIGAFYFRLEGWKYCRLASGLVSNAYINIGTIERNYLVMERAADALAAQIRTQGIQADVVMWAQMWSVRSSIVLAEKLGIEQSIYTEKSWNDNELMKLKRHHIPLAWKRVIISEDIVTKGSTLRKMKSMIEDGGWEVVGIACVWNRHGTDMFDWVPLIACYVPEQFELYHDDSTPEEQRKNYPRLPDNAEVSPKPKNEWDELVASMR